MPPAAVMWQMPEKTTCSGTFWKIYEMSKLILYKCYSTYLLRKNTHQIVIMHKKTPKAPIHQYSQYSGFSIARNYEV